VDRLVVVSSSASSTRMRTANAAALDLSAMKTPRLVGSAHMNHLLELVNVLEHGAIDARA
jgi:hypothetical protein